MPVGYLRHRVAAAKRQESTASRVVTHIKVSAARASGVGAGILFYAKDTGRFLIGLRSSECEAPQTWANFGGGVEKGETPQQGAKREVWEEAGYKGPVELQLMYSSKQPGFTYHNFLGTVESEFVPKLNDEHTDHLWAPISEFPDELHPEFAKALQSPEARRVLQSLGV